MTSDIASHSPRPPALTALDAYPWIRESVQRSLAQQHRRLRKYAAARIGHQSTLAHLHELITTLPTGLIVVEGMPGSGVSTLLAHLAMNAPYAFWFADDDAGQGESALYSQLVALHHVPVPLVPPHLHRLYGMQALLREAATYASSEQPWVLLIDPPATTIEPLHPVPFLLPSTLPPNVLLVIGAVPGMRFPMRPAARVSLLQRGDEVLDDQYALLAAMQCPPTWIEPLVTCAGGNFLALRLGYGLCRGAPTYAAWGDPTQLPTGLEALHDAWWASMDGVGRQLALLLAAAGEPLPRSLGALLLGTDPLPLIDGYWMEHVPATEHEHGHAMTLAHWATRDYLARVHHGALQGMHAELVNLAQSREIERGATHGDVVQGYLRRQFARHATLAPVHLRGAALETVTTRSWMMTQERHHSLLQAAHDVAWDVIGIDGLSCPIEPTEVQSLLLRLIRSAMLTGTLFSRVSTMSPDDAVTAFTMAMEGAHGNTPMARDVALRRVRALVDELPDGNAKALVLRRLGETCYSLNARTSAMRLLSEALDMEDLKVPASWRTMREQLYTTLVGAAIRTGDVGTARGISERIGHVERRGIAQKQIADWLREHGNLDEAQTVANHIQHESLRAWTLAELAVTLARSGEMEGAEAILAQVEVETANAWAQIELACDAVAHDLDGARARIDALPTTNQRNHGLTRLAEAMVLAGHHTDALEVAAHITNMGVRLTALLNLVDLNMDRGSALRALEQATAGIGMLEHDVRVPLVAMLTASYAALGNSEKALSLASHSAEGEERDRALSRVAVALVKHGNDVQGLATARALEDDDERDWTLDEIIHILTEEQRWEEAFALTQEIQVAEQRANSMADIAIARARYGNPCQALKLAAEVEQPAERTRAVRLILPELVAHGHLSEALSASNLLAPCDVSRYLLAVVVALAEHGDLEQSIRIIRHIPHPLDQAHAHLALAQHRPPNHALADLVSALQMATLGRTETYQLLEQAVPLLVTLGGAHFLGDVAATLDELDSW